MITKKRDTKKNQPAAPAEFTLEHPSAVIVTTHEINNLVTDTLSESEKKFGLELQAKFPDVVAAAAAVAAEEQTMARKYFNLADALRKTGLNGRELTLLMASLGYRKQRITEIKKAISVADDVWQKWKDNVIGFRAVLAIARAPDAAPAATPEAEAGATPPESPPEGRKTNILVIPADIQTAFADVLVDCPDAGHLLPVSPGYYQMTYEVYLPSADEAEGVARKRRKFMLSVEVTDEEVK